MRRWAFLLLLPAWALAIEYAPWYERILFFEGRVNTAYEGGSHVDLVRNEASLCVTPWTNLRAEFEIDFFKSRHYTYCLESLQLSAQYRLFNDAYGDPISLSGALTFVLPTTRAKREYSLFYPGSMEYEAHVAVGKEWACQDPWSDRAYIDIAYGIANEHAPWWRTHSQYDRNLFEWGVGSLFINTVAGSSVRYLEFGAIYTYLLDYGSIALELARRPIAHGFPQATSVTLEYQTPLAF